MFIATPRPEPPKPRRGEMYAPGKHIPPLRGNGAYLRDFPMVTAHLLPELAFYGSESSFFQVCSILGALMNIGTSSKRASMTLQMTRHVTHSCCELYALSKRHSPIRFMGATRVKSSGWSHLGLSPPAG